MGLAHKTLWVIIPLPNSNDPALLFFDDSGNYVRDRRPIGRIFFYQACSCCLVNGVSLAFRLIRL
jgi:hypothetical protein